MIRTEYLKLIADSWRLFPITDTLWLRGGFPPAFLAESDDDSGHPKTHAVAMPKNRREAIDSERALITAVDQEYRTVLLGQ